MAQQQCLDFFFHQMSFFQERKRNYVFVTMVFLENKRSLTLLLK